LRRVVDIVDAISIRDALRKCARPVRHASEMDVVQRAAPMHRPREAIQKRFQQQAVMLRPGGGSNCLAFVLAALRELGRSM